MLLNFKGGATYSIHMCVNVLSGAVVSPQQQALIRLQQLLQLCLMYTLHYIKYITPITPRGGVRGERGRRREVKESHKENVCLTYSASDGL